RKAAERAQAEGGPGLSDWEEEFAREVEERIETFGSAFADPEKGNLDEPLSGRQAMKLKEIDKKSRGKGGMKRGKGFKQKGPPRRPYGRDINEDLEEEVAPPAVPPKPSKPELVKASELLPKDETPEPAPEAQSPKGRPKFRVIKGGVEE
ncbi:MAG: hypothetical protein V3V03_07125, partial [Hyphomonadaceae bacterium]